MSGAAGSIVSQLSIAVGAGAIMMPMKTGGSCWGALAQVLVLVLQLRSATAPLGSFCATEERGCFRDCYDPAKKQCELQVVVWSIATTMLFSHRTDPVDLPLIGVRQTGDRPPRCTHRAHATLRRRCH